MVGTLVTELEHREYCQELNELVAELTARVRVRLESRSGRADPRGGDWSALRELLAVGFPLATRSAPACRDCGLCGGVKDQVAPWLEKAPTAVGG